MSEEVITEAEIEAASEWAWRLANVIVMGRHGVGNAAVLTNQPSSPTSSHAGRTCAHCGSP
jgi:hypothetical protein